MLRKIMLFLFLITSTTLFADGFFITYPYHHHHHHPPIWPPPIRPIPKESSFSLDIKYHNVDVKIENQVAKYKVVQEIYNPHNRRLVAEYIFPIPENAFISNFYLFIDGKKVEGKIYKKDEANRIFQDIVNKMKDPAVLEYYNQNIFRTKIYPVEPNSCRKVEIEYIQTLKKEMDLTEMIYPLSTEKFSNSKLDKVSVNVNIKDKNPISMIYSPSHKVYIKKKGDNEANISYEKENVKPEKNFSLYYKTSSKSIDMSLMTYKKSDENGFFLLNIVPNSFENEKEFRKNVIFVLDTSGSMLTDNKIEKAKESLKFCLKQLKESDKFNILNFSSSVNSFKEKSVAVKDFRDKGLEFIKDIEAIGGTNIEEALETAYKNIEEKISNIVIFLTDGKPTVGLTDSNEIISKFKKTKEKSVTLFNIGIGFEINTHLLDKLSQNQYGFTDYFKPNEDLEIKISNFYKKVTMPAINKAKVAIINAEAYDILPKDIGSIFYKSKKVVLGRFKKTGDKLIRLKGEYNGKSKIIDYEASFKEDEKFSFIPFLWANRKIAYLLDQIRLSKNKNNRELIDSIITLSKKYGIVTEYTSYLVKENSHDIVRMSNQEINRRYRISSNIKRDFEADSGFVAVKKSKGLSQMKAAESVGASFDDLREESGKKIEVNKKLKIILDQAFIYDSNDKKWISSEYKDQELSKIKFGSKEYFKFLKEKNSKMFIMLGKFVIFKLNNKFYEIVE